MQNQALALIQQALAAIGLIPLVASCRDIGVAGFGVIPMNDRAKHPHVGDPVPQDKGSDGLVLGLHGQRGAHLEFAREGTVLEGCEQSIEFLQGGAVGGFEGFDGVDSCGEGLLEGERGNI